MHNCKILPEIDNTSVTRGWLGLMSVMDQWLTHFLFPVTVLRLCKFPAVSAVEMKIYGRSLQALPFFPTTHTHSSFCVLLLCLLAHEHPLELVHASYMASCKADFLCTLISHD